MVRSLLNLLLSKGASNISGKVTITGDYVILGSSCNKGPPGKGWIKGEDTEEDENKIALLQ